MKISFILIFVFICDSGSQPEYREILLPFLYSIVNQEIGQDQYLITRTVFATAQATSKIMVTLKVIKSDPKRVLQLKINVEIT
jgi:hypothetical protein